MKGMILAGGMSTRLYPLTKSVPKALVPVAGVPNVVHVIRYLKRHGIDEIAINVHYFADAIVAALGNGSNFDVQITYLHEPELLGSAGAVKQMEAFFSGGDFVVVGCDDLTNLPLEHLFDFHRRRDALATLGTVERADVSQYGVVVVDAHHRITGFQEKPEAGTQRSNHVNTGIYAFSPKIFEYIPAETFYDFGKQVFPALQEADAAFYGFDAHESYWCDIGTPDEYRRASFDVVNGVLEIPQTCGSGIDPAAHIAAGARIDGNVWIGEGAHVADGARIVGPSVIGAGTTIGANATITRTLVWSDAAIGDGATLSDVIIGNAYHVTPGSTLTNEVLAKD